MTLLCITPDSASHYLPLAAVARRWRLAGEDAVVATGPALASRVRADGFTHQELILGPRSNADAMRPESLGESEQVRLQAFVDATRRGMIETFRHQAEARLSDLLWNPMEVVDRIAAILDSVQPRYVISVQLAYNATAALLALRTPFATLVTGHPAQVPGPGEIYGYPHVRPPRFVAHPADLAALAGLCRHIERVFTDEFNRVMARVDPHATLVPNALAAGSPRLVLHNYPAELGGYRRPMLPVHARFVGATVRHEGLDVRSAEWLRDTESSRPTVLVAFGGSCSLRTDVLQRVVEALRRSDFRVLFATGATDPNQLGIPPDWYVGTYLPQVALLDHCDLAVGHGGNNTVLESLTAGVPLVVGPFSSDQFASAADIERHGLGAVFDPNTSTPDEILSLIHQGLDACEGARDLGRRLRARPGVDKVRREICAAFGS